MAANCDSCDDEYTQDEFEGVLKPYSFEQKRQDREINVDISESKFIFVEVYFRVKR